MTISDIDRMATEKERLESSLSAASTRVEESKKRVAEKELTASRKLDELEKTVDNRVQERTEAKPSALAGVDVNQATRDSVRALMLIRAYRMRGHFHARLDPLGLEPARDHQELDPRAYGFTEVAYAGP